MSRDVFSICKSFFLLFFALSFFGHYVSNINQPGTEMDGSLEGILARIEQLYTPNQSAETVAVAQREIQALQRSDEAFLMAHQLLQCPQQAAQFTGAATYTVYITNHSEKVDASFGQQIVAETCDVIQRDLNKMVIQKMFSNVSKLVTVLRANLIESLFSQLQSLALESTKMIQLALLMISNLFDELSRGESRKFELHQLVHEQIWPMAQAVLSQQEGFTNFKNLWFDTLSSCITYVSKAEFETNLTYNLNPFLGVCIDAMQYSNDMEAMDIILEIYDTNQSLINVEMKNKLDAMIFNSEWVWKSIQANDYEDNEKLAKVISSFMQGDIISLASKLVKDEMDYKFDILLALTQQNDRLPIAEEPFSKELLNFWVLFAEAFDFDYDNIVSLIKSPEKVDKLKSKSTQIFLKLSNIYWGKSHLLPHDHLLECKENFRVFRRDITELFEGMVTLVQTELFNSLTNSIISNLSNINENILKLESSLFLLNSISSVFNENNVQLENIQAISSLFQSSYFETLSSMLDQYTNNDGQPLAPYLTKTSIAFISEITWFYKSQGAEYLPNTLDFLFKCLQTPIKNDGFDFQESSSKSILKISQSCRNQLTSLIPVFEVSSNNILRNSEISSNVKSRIIRSYAAILQPIEDYEIKATSLARILDIILEESRRVITLTQQTMNSTQLEQISDHILSLLSSMVGLSKGSQLPSDWEELFSLNDSDEPDYNTIMKVSQFWINDPFNIHSKCISIIQIYLPILNIKSTLSKEIIQIIVSFFKSGISEILPGPFVLSYDSMLEFVVMCFQSVPGGNLNQLNELMDIYSAIVRGISIDNSQPKTLVTLLNGIRPVSNIHIHQMFDLLILNPLTFITQDPDMLQATFHMINTILTTIPNSIIPSSSQGLPMNVFKKIISLALGETLKSKERFVIKSICEFWINISHNKKFTKADKDFIEHFLTDELDQNLLSKDIIHMLSSRNDDKIITYGQFILQMVMLGMLNSARSNMDFYAEVLRIYVGDHPAYIRNWLNEVMKKLLENKLVDQERGNEFVKKLIVSRGQRIALKIIKQFWIDATGNVDFHI